MIGLPFLQDHAVLPRDAPLRFGGQAAPGKRVTVTIADASGTTEADSEGRWVIELPPFPAGVGFEASVDLEGIQTFRDICFGDLWLCAGQSNMDMTLEATENGPAEASAARDSLIREWRVTRRLSYHPSSEISGGWHRCDSEAASTASAIGYYFAKGLRKDLKVPIGIIRSTWGSTIIASWISRETLMAQTCARQEFDRWWEQARREPDLGNRFSHLFGEWQADMVQHRIEVERPYAETLQRAIQNSEIPPPPPMNLPQGVGSPRTPGAIYNAMIAPLFALPLRGVLWYQGESDTWTESSTFAYRAANYETLLKALIESWRKGWGQKVLPFIVVQLSSFDSRIPETADTGWAAIRNAQAAAGRIPYVAVVPTFDVREPYELHPHQKSFVGERASRVALEISYGRMMDAQAPRFARAVFGMDRVEVFIETASGLRPMSRHLAPSFQASTEGSSYFSTEVEVGQSSIVCFSPRNKPVTSIRYAWADNPDCTVIGKNGLPLLPFSINKPPVQ